MYICAAHQWDARGRVSHTGYNGKKLNCATAQSLGAFRGQTFTRPACAPGLNTSQWDGRDRVSHTGYIGEQMNGASAQKFGAFRRQTLWGSACTHVSSTYKSASGTAQGCRNDRQPSCTDRVSHTRLNGIQTGCATAQKFGAFRRRTF